VNRPETATCQGDSGGPLMYAENGTYYVYGIVSNGYKCNRTEAYYASVPYFYNWIAGAVVNNI
jgi:secreted trypsin-like serine protease